MNNEITNVDREELQEQFGSLTQAIKPGEAPINKLLEFQKKVSAISKDSVNPFFKSKYFDVNTVIDTIKPILNEVGLVIIQPLGWYENKTVIKTIILDGEKVLATSEVELPKIEDVQKMGAAITYYRRYSLVSLLLLQGEEDDDGNKVSTKQSKPLKQENMDNTDPLEGAPARVRPATNKQLSMITALLDQKEVKGKDGQPIPHTDLDKLTSSEASAWIKKLMDMPRPNHDDFNQDVEISKSDLPE